MSQFTGVFAASVTPLRQDYCCDTEALAAHCQDLLTRGCSGVVLFGTTGEGPSFSLRERKEALKKVIELGVDPQKIIVGATFSALDDVVELANFAMEQGTLAQLIAPPFFYKNVSDEGVYAFYKALVARTKAKIILYHIPQQSGVAISFSVTERLVHEFPESIVGLKESEANLPFTKELLARLPQLHLFVGSERMLFEAQQAGAKAAISGLANCFPEKVAALFQAADPFFDALKKVIAEFPIFPAIKCLVAQKKGASFLRMRPPVMALSENERTKLLQAVEKL